MINLDCREGKNVAKTAQLRGAIEKLLAVTIVRNACCDSHRIKFNPRPDQSQCQNFIFDREYRSERS